MAPLSPVPSHVRKSLLLVIKLNEWHKKSQGETSVTNVANSVLPVSSQGGTRRCYYYGNQLLRNTFLFHRNSLLRPPSPWDFRRHFSSRGPLKRGCKRNCVSTQWVPQCCANHYGRDCWGKEPCDPFSPQPFLLWEGGISGSAQMAGVHGHASSRKGGQNPRQGAPVYRGCRE